MSEERVHEKSQDENFRHLYRFPLARERAYQLMQDPEVLARAMPGCEGLGAIVRPVNTCMKMKMALGRSIQRF